MSKSHARLVVEEQVWLNPDECIIRITEAHSGTGNSDSAAIRKAIRKLCDSGGTDLVTSVLQDIEQGRETLDWDYYPQLT